VADLQPSVVPSARTTTFEQAGQLNKQAKRRAFATDAEVEAAFRRFDR